MVAVGPVLVPFVGVSHRISRTSMSRLNVRWLGCCIYLCLSLNKEKRQTNEPKTFVMSGYWCQKEARIVKMNLYKMRSRQRTCTSFRRRCLGQHIWVCEMSDDRALSIRYTVLLTEKLNNERQRGLQAHCEPARWETRGKIQEVPYKICPGNSLGWRKVGRTIPIWKNVGEQSRWILGLIPIIWNDIQYSTYEWSGSKWCTRWCMMYSTNRIRSQAIRGEGGPGAHDKRGRIWRANNTIRNKTRSHWV
jgi:hypothetical protein